MMSNESIIYKQIDKVCEISVVDKRLASGYQYYKEFRESRFLRSPIIYRNVFIRFFSSCDGGTYTEIYTREKLLSYKLSDGRSEYIIDEFNDVYYRPYVYVKFDSKHIDGHTKYFDTFEDAKIWTEEFIQKYGFDKILIKF